jgi:hypothetical protein
MSHLKNNYIKEEKMTLIQKSGYKRILFKLEKRKMAKSKEMT